MWESEFIDAVHERTWFKNTVWKDLKGLPGPERKLALIWMRLTEYKLMKANIHKLLFSRILTAARSWCCSFSGWVGKGTLSYLTDTTPTSDSIFIVTFHHRVVQRWGSCAVAKDQPVELSVVTSGEAKDSFPGTLLKNEAANWSQWLRLGYIVLIR